MAEQQPPQVPTGEQSHIEALVDEREMRSILDWFPTQACSSIFLIPTIKATEVFEVDHTGTRSPDPPTRCWQTAPTGRWARTP